MALTIDPMALNHAIRLRPRSILSQSRSPSHSPLRRTQFTAQELDPLLGNLSPDSTLRALQATDTISGGQRVPDALEKSIADASTFERELGVRAALAAQKLREWLQEIGNWHWPSGRECALGVGFLTRETNGKPSLEADPYVGSLRSSQLNQYKARLIDIQGALDVLEIEDVKDYVLNAHVPAHSSQQRQSQMAANLRMSYGRMRDFTALITATIIRALPDLAKLNLLLIAWQARLTVLEVVPQFLHELDSARSDVQKALLCARDEDLGAALTQLEFENTKSKLSGEVSSVGTQVDRMLDLLEGHDDRLPQGWIDTLEKVELDFATWAVEGQRRVLHNEWLVQTGQNTATAPIIQPQSPPIISSTQIDVKGSEIASDIDSQQELHPTGAHNTLDSQPSLSSQPSALSEQPLEDTNQEIAQRNLATGLASVDLTSAPSQHGMNEDPESTPLAAKAGEPFAFLKTEPVSSRTTSQQNPSLTLELPKSGHKREVSEVSIADSAYSAFSDISNAEIIDARATEVLASPKISLVENPFRASRDDLSSFSNFSPSSNEDGTNDSPQIDSRLERPVSENLYASPPLLIQRASTASMELIGKSQIKRVTLSRTTSQDLRALIPTPTETTPSQALAQLTGDDRTGETDATGFYSTADHTALRSSPTALRLPHHLLQDLSPINTQSPVSGAGSLDSPSIPRRSSKRRKQDLGSPVTPVSAASEKVDSPSGAETYRKDKSSPADEKLIPSPGKPRPADGTLQSKIQDILTSLPTAIRLANDSDSSESSSQPSTASSTRSSTRSSTPAPGLVLSPAKKDKLARRSTGNDSEVRVYHLTRPGQSRDTPPTRLFVRLVGEGGQRVMVRVGGGWADLGEYLREYSLHHGRRSLVDGHLEVANFPSGQSPKDIGVGTPPAGPGSLSKAPSGSIISRAKSRSPETSGLTFDFANLRDVDAQAARRSTDPIRRARSPDSTTWTPPVPPIPTSFTMSSPTTVSTISTGTSSTGMSTYVTKPDFSASSIHSRTTTGDSYSPISRSVTATGPGFSTTTTISNQSYTPLGAAGPKTANKNAGRRVATLGAIGTSDNDAWVEDLVDRARAVSGSTLSPMTTESPGPLTTTTTTTIFSTPASRRVSGVVGESPSSGGRTTPNMSSTPTSRRASAMMLSESPASGRGTPTPSPVVSTENVSPRDRSKSRMSFGDVSGIKRVFLRRKSEK